MQVTLPLNYYLRILRGIVVKGIGIEYLWGKPVKLETSEVVSQPQIQTDATAAGPSRPITGKKEMPEIRWRRVVYTMENRKLTKREI